MPGFEDVRAGANLKASAQNLTLLSEKSWELSRYIRQVRSQEQALAELSQSLAVLKRESTGNTWASENSAFRQGVDIGTGLAHSVLYGEQISHLGFAFEHFVAEFGKVTDPEPSEAIEKKRSFMSGIGWQGIALHPEIRDEIDTIIANIHPQQTQPEWLLAGCGTVLWIVNAADILATKQIATDMAAESIETTPPGTALDLAAWALYDASRDPS